MHFWCGVRLDTEENVCMEGLVRHWNRLPRKVAELLSLEVLKNTWVWLVVVLAVLGAARLDHLRRLFHLEFHLLFRQLADNSVWAG